MKDMTEKEINGHVVIKHLRVMKCERGYATPRPLTPFHSWLLFKCLMTTSPFTLLLTEKHLVRHILRGCGSGT
jgi:hypothetical protein